MFANLGRPVLSPGASRFPTKQRKVWELLSRQYLFGRLYFVVRMVFEMAKKKKPAKFDSLQQEAYLSLWRTYDRLRMIEDELFSSWNITPQQYNILRILQASHPAPIPTLQISNRLVSRAPDITRMLDKLEKLGWIVRNRSDSDRRAVMIGITESGLKLIAKIAEPLRQSHVAQIGHMSESELTKICELMRRVREPHEPDGSVWR